MAEILTITLNPAIDLATSVTRVVAGPKLYCRAPRIDPGGGGVNVARTICQLGGDARALVAIGGAQGARLLDLLGEEGVPVHPVPVRGETRESFAVTDESTNAQFRFSVPGEVLGEDDAERLLSAITERVAPDQFVVLSGGVALGLGDGFPAQIQAAIAPKTRRLIVDTSHSALMRLIEAPQSPLFLLRLDQEEAEEAAGSDFEGVEDSIAFAETLIARGVSETVVIGQRVAGSLLVSKDHRYLCRTPLVPVHSKIGAGDASVGAMTMALSEGAPPDEALRRVVVAAAATMDTEGTGLCHPEEVARLMPECEIETL